MFQTAKNRRFNIKRTLNKTINVLSLPYPFQSYFMFLIFKLIVSVSCNLLKLLSSILDQKNIPVIHHQ